MNNHFTSRSRIAEISTNSSLGSNAFGVEQNLDNSYQQFIDDSNSRIVKHNPLYQKMTTNELEAFKDKQKLDIKHFYFKVETYKDRSFKDLKNKPSYYDYETVAKLYPKSLLGYLFQIDGLPKMQVTGAMIKKFEEGLVYYKRHKKGEKQGFNKQMDFEGQTKKLKTQKDNEQTFINQQVKDECRNQDIQIKNGQIL